MGLKVTAAAAFKSHVFLQFMIKEPVLTLCDIITYIATILQQAIC